MFARSRCQYLLVKSYLKNTKTKVTTTMRPLMTSPANRRLTELGQNVEIVYKPFDRSRFEPLLADESNPAITAEAIDTILAEYESAKFSTGEVPSELTLDQMRTLLSEGIENANVRRRKMTYMYIVEASRYQRAQERLLKQEQLRQALLERPDWEPGALTADGSQLNEYRLWGNCLVTRVAGHNWKRRRYLRGVRHSALFGPTLIYDLDYDDYMLEEECAAQARHVQRSVRCNLLEFQDPFNIIFTNCDWSKPTLRKLKETFLDEPPMNMLDVKSSFLPGSYLEYFEKERLVYLSPHAPEPLAAYNPEDIYIIGGFVDKYGAQQELSSQKATRDGIRQYRLPLDEYLRWQSGTTKRLCTLWVVRVLNALKNGVPMSAALEEQLPTRIYQSPESVPKSHISEEALSRIRAKLETRMAAFRLDGPNLGYNLLSIRPRMVRI